MVETGIISLSRIQEEKHQHGKIYKPEKKKKKKKTQTKQNKATKQESSGQSSISVICFVSAKRFSGRWQIINAKHPPRE